MFAELRLGEGCQSYGPHHDCTLGVLNMDMVPHAQMRNTELPNFFVPEEPKGKAHPQLFLGREGCG